MHYFLQNLAKHNYFDNVIHSFVQEEYTYHAYRTVVYSVIICSHTCVIMCVHNDIHDH